MTESGPRDEIAAMNSFDLSILLRKQVTAPILLWVLWLLYRDFEESKKKLIADFDEKSYESSPRQSERWKPVKPMREQIISIQSEEKENYRAWDETEPYPYKPFKPGEHRLTMGVTTIPLTYWFVLDKTYRDRIEKKWDILRTEYEDQVYHLDPAMIRDGTPENEPEGMMNARVTISEEDVEHANEALCQLYANVVSYLVCRFPQYFQIVLSPGETAGAVFNSILREYHPVDAVRYMRLTSDEPQCVNYRCFNTDIIPDKLAKDLDVLEDEIGYRVLISCDKTRRAHELILSMARMVEDDLILLSPNTAKQYNGEYILHSGLFAFAAGFNPRNRFLKPLTLIHGPVPEYKRDLQSQMNKFFDKLRPHTLANRVNYTFQNHDNLYVKRKFTDSRARTVEELHGGKDLHYRSERQTLVKFDTPDGRNVTVFGIRTYLWNFQDEFLVNNFYSQPEIVEELRQAITGMNDILGKYKGRPEWGPPLINIIEHNRKLNMAH